jgi:hypothetical protein
LPGLRDRASGGPKGVKRGQKGVKKGSFGGHLGVPEALRRPSGGPQEALRRPFWRPIWGLFGAYLGVLGLWKAHIRDMAISGYLGYLGSFGPFGGHLGCPWETPFGPLLTHGSQGAKRPLGTIGIRTGIGWSPAVHGSYEGYLVEGILRDAGGAIWGIWGIWG